MWRWSKAYIKQYYFHSVENLPSFIYRKCSRYMVQYTPKVQGVWCLPIYSHKCGTEASHVYFSGLHTLVLNVSHLNLFKINCHITFVLMPWPISMPPCEIATVPSCWYMVTCTPYPHSEMSGMSYLTGSIDKPLFFHRLSCGSKRHQVRYPFIIIKWHMEKCISYRQVKKMNRLL